MRFFVSASAARVLRPPVWTPGATSRRALKSLCTRSRIAASQSSRAATENSIMQLKMEQRGVRSELRAPAALNTASECRRRLSARRLGRPGVHTGVAGARGAEAETKNSSACQIRTSRRYGVRRGSVAAPRPKEAERAAPSVRPEREAFQPSQQAEDDLAR